MSPVYYGTIHRITFTPDFSGPDLVLGVDVEPWVVIGGRVCHRTLGITVTPTDDYRHRHSPQELCEALNRVYGNRSGDSTPPRSDADAQPPASGP